jgi:hypothetical protein
VLAQQYIPCNNVAGFEMYRDRERFERLLRWGRGSGGGDLPPLTPQPSSVIAARYGSEDRVESVRWWCWNIEGSKVWTGARAVDSNLAANLATRE